MNIWDDRLIKEEMIILILVEGVPIMIGWHYYVKTCGIHDNGTLGGNMDSSWLLGIIFRILLNDLNPWTSQQYHIVGHS